MNPARSFGPAVVGGIFGIGARSSFDHHYIYYAGPLIGATVAGVIYK
jgi:glycerol uptake facilitator-like aquaporin